jgi:chromatin segregation and condensation protein Rec8/ScpA/Scc1 (kleisin family)
MDDPHASLPESDPASPLPASVSPEDEESDVDLSHLPDEHRGAIRRLRRQVERAAATIEHLRAENERLRQRVEELEAQPAFPEDETVLTFDDDPETLQTRITQFIDAIDTYLETVPSEPPADEESEA